MHWASSRGNLDIMEMLISGNCDIEARDKVSSIQGDNLKLMLYCDIGIGVAGVNIKPEAKHIIKILTN